MRERHDKEQHGGNTVRAMCATFYKWRKMKAGAKTQTCCTLSLKAKPFLKDVDSGALLRNVLKNSSPVLYRTLYSSEVTVGVKYCTWCQKECVHQSLLCHLHVARHLFWTGGTFGSIFSHFPPSLYPRGVQYAWDQQFSVTFLINSIVIMIVVRLLIMI